MQEPTLKAEPIDGLADQEISLTVAGLRPRQRITLRSEMSGSKGDLWSASALFDADDRGRVDIATAIPLEGSYLTADPMGLIWSMRSRPYSFPRRRPRFPSSSFSAARAAG